MLDKQPPSLSTPFSHPPTVAAATAAYGTRWFAAEALKLFALPCLFAAAEVLAEVRLKEKERGISFDNDAVDSMMDVSGRLLHGNPSLPCHLFQCLFIPQARDTTRSNVNIAPSVLITSWVLQAMTKPSISGNIIVEYILQLLGLTPCAGTPVGSNLMPGISGGEKKRLTVGEELVGPKRVFFLDEISTGLDSSTTFLIASCLQRICHDLNATMLISLLQVRSDCGWLAAVCEVHTEVVKLPHSSEHERQWFPKLRVA